MAPDPPWQADGPPGTGDQTQRELRKRDPHVGRGDDTGRERRELDPRTETGAVEVDDDAIGEVGEHPSDAGREPDEVGSGRIGKRPELVEITAAAVVGAVPTEVHRRDVGVGDCDRQCVEETVTELRIECVADSRAVEHDLQLVAGPHDPHDLSRGPVATARRPRFAPPCELRTGLQRRVAGGLDKQPLLEGTALGTTQQGRESDGCERGGLDERDDPLKLAASGGHDDVAPRCCRHAGRRVIRWSRGDSHDHRRHTGVHRRWWTVRSVVGRDHDDRAGAGRSEPGERAPGPRLGGELVAAEMVNRHVVDPPPRVSRTTARSPSDQHGSHGRGHRRDASCG